MSSDAAPAGSATLADEPHDATTVFNRPLGINRGIVKHRAPICHGVHGSFHLQDTDTEPPSDTPKFRDIPDGSLYQRCRLAWYRGEKHTQETQYGDREYVVLTDHPEFATVPDTDADTAIILTSSDFKAGRGEGDEYRPFYKYHLARRPLDDEGEPRLTASPKYTITATIQPQYADMVYPDGNALTLPYGEGTAVKAHVNYAPGEGAIFARINDLVRQGLGYSLDYRDLLTADDPDYFDVDDDELQHDGKARTNESRDLSRIEQYARVAPEYMGELQHTLSQSLDLIPSKGGRTRTIESKTDSEGRWLRYGFITQDFDVLGYPDTGDLEIGIKVYVDNHDARAPYCFPKLEAWVAGTNGEPLKWNNRDWEAINAVLREIVISHLHHAGISESGLRADDEYEPARREHFRVKHPLDRREWLREYYADLKSSVEFEARRTRTDLSRDILRALVYEGRDLTLAELETRTGATKRAISNRVAEMEAAGDENEPGIVERVRSAETHITMAREMRKHVRTTLNATHPSETWSDVLERAERRRERRHELGSSQFTGDADDADDTADPTNPTGESDEPGSGDGDADAVDDPPATRPLWKRLDETDGTRDDLDILPDEAIQVNVRARAWRPGS